MSIQVAKRNGARGILVLLLIAMFTIALKVDAGKLFKGVR